MVNYKLIKVDSDDASTVQKNVLVVVMAKSIDVHEPHSVTFLICSGKCQLSVTVLGIGSKFSD